MRLPWLNSTWLSSVVIARSEATKQSTHALRRDGLLRLARNDGSYFGPHRRPESHMPDFFGDVVKGRMPVDLRLRGLEHHALLGWIGCGDRVRRHDPDREALAAAGVDVARGLQRHGGVGGVQR